MCMCVSVFERPPEHTTTTTTDDEKKKSDALYSLFAARQKWKEAKHFVAITHIDTHSHAKKILQHA